METPGVYRDLLFSLYGIETIFNSPSVPIKEWFSIADQALVDRILGLASKYVFIKNYVTENEDVEGVYLSAWIENIDQTLEPYRMDLVTLEDKLKSNDFNLCYIWSVVERYSELFSYLNSLINEITSQNSYGCLFLQHLHKRLLTSTGVFKIALSNTIRGMNVVLFRHLSQWLLYGELNDRHSEFFIKRVDCSQENTMYKSFEEFVINEKMLPNHIKIPCAEKILKTGQMVLLLKMNPANKTTSRSYQIGVENDIFGNKEKYFLSKFKEIQNLIIWNHIGQFDKLLSEISSSVTSTLLHLTMNEAKLIQQLNLVKDMFLQGRGELFHQFIHEVTQQGNPDLYSIDCNAVLLESARKVLLKEDYLQNFTMDVKKLTDEKTDKTNVLINLKFEAPWPFKLLFTPSVLTSYNKIFRFLFRLKQMQIGLKNIWLSQKSNRREKVDRGKLLLQHNLLSLLNNLQYYIQVDVLDSQFKSLELSVGKCKHFDDILYEHNKFLTNVICQLFIPVKEDEDSDKTSAIYKLLNNILVICEEYLRTNEEVVDIQYYQRFLHNNVKFLLEIGAGLTNRSIHPSSNYLSQFLLRLDFNSYFTQSN